MDYFSVSAVNRTLALVFEFMFSVHCENMATIFGVCAEVTFPTLAKPVIMYISYKMKRRFGIFAKVN